MDYRFASLTWVVATCVASLASLHAQSVPTVSLTPIPADSTATTVSGRDLMSHVVRRITEHRTVTSKVRYRSELFGQKLVGSGTYLQSRQGERLQVRFSVSVKTADRVVSLLHVCDGRTLWMFDNLSGRGRLGRVDLLRLRQTAAERGGPLMPIMLGGGLPQLLGSLEQDFLAAPPQSVVFQEVPVWAIALRWNPQRLSNLLGRQDLFDEQGQLMPAQLPEQLPDRVFLLVGQDDLFPYHIDFRRSTSDDLLSSVKLSKKSGSRSVTTMELFEVQFDAPLDPMLFVYKPGNIEIDDQTDKYLTQLQKATANR